MEIQVLSYNLCLLFIKDGRDNFAIVGIQTDDILTIAISSFSEKEEKELQETRLIAKPKEFLSHNQPLRFNRYKIQLKKEDITIIQKDQTKQLQLVDNTTNDTPQQYIAQQTRDAYLASICQPEASYDLSVATQVTEPEKIDIDTLNKRLR